MMVALLLLTSANIMPATSEIPIQPAPQAQACDENPPPGYTKTIRGLVDGDELTLTVSSRFGGAVESVLWRGKEFINTWDHGREISYAWGMDDYGECLNPTEPGQPAITRTGVTSRLQRVATKGTPDDHHPARLLVVPGVRVLRGQKQRSQVTDQLFENDRDRLSRHRQ
jgi:hypothetical protein